MKSAGLFGAVLSCLIVLGAAQPGDLSAQSTRGGGGTSSRRNTTPSVPRPSRSQPDRQQVQPQLIFVSGVVVQEDGAPLPTGVVIERNCNGRVTRETYVDAAGHFSFQIGGISRSASVLPDASDESGAAADMFGGRNSRPSAGSSVFDRQAPVSLMGCEVRARLAGYRSTPVMLGSGSSVGQIDMGTIVLYPLSKVQGTLVSATDMAAPKPARKAFGRFEKAFRKNDLAEAEKNLKSALEIYPHYAAAWYGLGQVYESMQRLDEAKAALSKAVEVDHNYVGPYIHLARLAVLEQKWQAAAELSDRAIELDPVDFVDAYYLNSAANYYMNRLDSAERSGRKTEQMDPLHRIPQVHLILANILRRRNDAEGAIEQLQRYLAAAPESAQAGAVREQVRKLTESGSRPVATTQSGP